MSWSSRRTRKSAAHVRHVDEAVVVHGDGAGEVGPDLRSLRFVNLRLPGRVADDRQGAVSEQRENFRVSFVLPSPS